MHNLDDLSNDIQGQTIKYPNIRQFQLFEWTQNSDIRIFFNSILPKNLTAFALELSRYSSVVTRI